MNSIVMTKDDIKHVVLLRNISETPTKNDNNRTCVGVGLDDSTKKYNSSAIPT